MSIRMIARDLYRLEQEVERVQKELEAAAYEEREDIRYRLMKLRVERDRVRRILEGSKEPPSYRRPL